MIRTDDAILRQRPGGALVARLVVAAPAPESVRYGGQTWLRTRRLESGAVEYVSVRPHSRPAPVAVLMARRQRIEQMARARRAERRLQAVACVNV